MKNYIEIARAGHPLIQFENLDLNLINAFDKKSEIVTCFETIEHVGNMSNALKTLRNAASETSVILSSVPIEIGVVGILKYITKRYIFSYNLELNCSDSEYLIAFLLGKRIKRFRHAADFYGNHFGFDYRDLDEEVDSIFTEHQVQKYNSGTTRFYKILICKN